MEFKSDAHRKAVCAEMGKKSPKTNENLSINKIQKSPERETSNSLPVISNLAIRIIPIIFPHTQIFFTGYNVGRMFYNIYNQIQIQKNLPDNIASSLIMGGIVEGISKISEPIISLIAQEIIKSAESTGVIEQISKSTKVNKEVYSSMLEGTIKDRMLSGVEDFISYTIGGLL